VLVYQDTVPLGSAKLFIGHYGAALASKRLSRRLPLIALFLAAQLLDILFSVFVVAGIEKMRIVHRFTPYNPYDLYWMPYTHSLLGALIWSLLVALLGFAVTRRISRSKRGVVAVVLGATVFSHFALDASMHVPDLPIGFGAGSPKIGLGLVKYPPVAMLAEFVALLIGGAIYLRSTRPTSRGAVIMTATFGSVLVFLLVAIPFFPDPSSNRAFAMEALSAYALLAAAAGAVDVRRRSRNGVAAKVVSDSPRD
jgi:hypothetical protein